ncbi:dCTP deaminase [Pseudomonas lijiangensis]|uniref:Deoxycytidine deaminase n=1 Tax=Pseudomonas lijiangensis TaxID=2995658 RepID=A0ABX8HVF9_9PSED|nr:MULTISPECIES: deoxycytidine deaminase [Pseudomonas syringae group]MBX8502991.1 deoxycytidine deaminase [Pseudomonas lijiangensis]MBX8505148.1 deoxycytidine deaminase [Pseudomonas lijiangensis]MBX8555746.1 deoxycytidine deaminase [Pseudomonas cichorii]QWU84512.1 deoxycytidine deaminase [Pseudomonas lijiangensis]
MIYSPKSLTELVQDGKVIRNLSDRELLVPEGVGFDLRLKNVSCLTDGCGSLKITTRRTPSSKLLVADADGCVMLKPGKTYLATTIEEFDLPEYLAAQFFPRSTLFRSGVSFASSVLPPGYIGPMTFALTNHHHDPFEIEIGARFAHVIFHTVSGDVGLYKGQWQGGRISQPKDEDQI